MGLVAASPFSQTHCPGRKTSPPPLASEQILLEAGGLEGVEGEHKCGRESITFPARVVSRWNLLTRLGSSLSRTKLGMSWFRSDKGSFFFSVHSRDLLALVCAGAGLG